ncbi:MFS transporter [Auraticoccus monumenti]|uniref:MFS transporter, UMF1 family n=1 Tax=Auraticoccus monumenti TaxID=675864 RepID=A0A1G7BMS6_9ACTN|nr:MFS transporter [Auraticoccus monumenti]SDE28283.1 MFS transporter, UMF1 family [Auraticoccus monumenti]
MDQPRAGDVQDPPLPSMAAGSVLADRVPLRRLLAWGSYDWGAASFQAVITSFVFATYVSSAVAPEGTGARWIAVTNAVTAVVVALSAAVIGQRADRLGRRRRNMLVLSLLVWASMVAMFWVRPEASYLPLALVLLGVSGIFMELANVSYHAMLQQVSTPRNVGRVSGFGWSLGYFGGIVLLLICYVGFIAPEVGWFGVTSEDGLNIRAVALLSAGWFVVFGLPIFFLVPETAADPSRPSTGLVGSYRALARDLVELWRVDRNTFRFLLASALYRDGLAAIFTLGAVLAVTVYGLGASDVLVFGIAANVLAALGALAGGFVEDRVGPRAVILVSVGAMVVAGTILLFVSGPSMFWVFGLLLTLWVGPAQSSSRALLTRLAPAGHEGQVFGLYTSTGRAASFLAPALFAVFAALGSDRTGIIGIVVVLLAGGVVMLWVRNPRRPVTSAPDPTAVR